MVKVTVECNGRVVTREGNLAVVAVASEAEDESGTVCEQIVLGHGTRYLEGAVKCLAESIPEVIVKSAGSPEAAMVLMAEFALLAGSAAKKGWDRVCPEFIGNTAEDSHGETETAGQF